MATYANTQFYKGYLAINGTPLPVLPGVRLSAPHNWDIPPIAGNYVQVNRGEGARNAVLTFQVAVLGGINGSPMDNTLFAGTSNIMDLLLARTNDSAHDTNPITTLTFFDGRIKWTMTNAKVERVSLSCSRGQRLAMDVTIVAANLSGAADAGGNSSWEAAGQVMTFANLNFGSTLANGVVSFELTYQNNHTPDPSINGNTTLGAAVSGFPNQMNASTATATLGLTFQLSDNGTSANEFGGLIGQGGQMSFTVLPASYNHLYTFTTGSLVLQNPNDRSLTMPRQFISTAYAVLGGGLGSVQWTASASNPLLQVSYT